LVEAQDPADILRKVAAHVRRHAPEVEFIAHEPGMLPSKTPLTSAYTAPIRRAILAARGVEPLLYPAGFGSLPGYASQRSSASTPSWCLMAMPTRLTTRQMRI
jgi:hypothetical protein